MKKSGKPDGNHSAIKAGKRSRSTGAQKGNDTSIPTDVGSKSASKASKWECDLTAKWKGLPGAGNQGVDISTDVGGKK